MMALGFTCSGCDRDFSYDSQELPLVGAYMIKTIASRYCVDCIPKEMAAHGLPRDRIIEMRRSLGRAVPE